MYNIEKKLTDEQKQQYLMEYRQKQERTFRTGKIIVAVLAITNVIVGVANFIVMPFSFFSIVVLILEIIFSIALYCGVAWVRYLFVIVSAYQAFVSFMSIFELNSYGGVSAEWYLLFTAILVYNIAFVILLFVNRSVSEFLYGQRNG